MFLMYTSVIICTMALNSQSFKRNTCDNINYNTKLVIESTIVLRCLNEKIKEVIIDENQELRMLKQKLLNGEPLIFSETLLKKSSNRLDRLVTNAKNIVSFAEEYKNFLNMQMRKCLLEIQAYREYLMESSRAKTNLKKLGKIKYDLELLTKK